MLFKHEDLVTEEIDVVKEAADLLNESVYLTEEESLLNVSTVPVCENKRLGTNIVSFSDIERLAEDFDTSYLDAMQAVAEANEISMDDLAVSVPEYEIIADPEIVNELSNVIIAPCNTNSVMYQICEDAFDIAVEEEDEELLEAVILNELSDELKMRAARKHGQRLELKGEMAMAYHAARKNGASKEELKDMEDKFKQAQQSTRRDLRRTRLSHYGAEHETDPEKATAHKINEISGKIVKGQESLERSLKKAKEAIKNSWPVKKIAELLSSLKTKFQNAKSNMPEDPSQRTVFQKVLAAVASMIDKLSNLLNKKKNESNADNVEQTSEKSSGQFGFKGKFDPAAAGA